MPVGSVIVKARKDKVDFVEKELAALKGVTVCKIHDKQDIVIVTDTRHQAEDERLWETIRHIPGVVHCDLIYYNFEDDEEGGHHDRQPHEET